MGKDTDNVRPFMRPGTEKPAYHEADEEWSGRRVVLNVGTRPTSFGECRIRIVHPFWKSPEEEALWVRAVRACPISEYGHLDLYAYLREVGKVALGLAAGGPKTMPQPRMTRRERDSRLMALRDQAKKLDSGKTGGA